MALWWSRGGGVFLMSEVPLYHTTQDFPISSFTDKNRAVTLDREE